MLVNLNTAAPPTGASTRRTAPSDTVSTDSLWGTIMSTGGVNPRAAALPLFNLARVARPTAVTNVEVRVYFDLSGTDVYNHIYSGGAVVSRPRKPLEVDTLELQLVPQPATF